MFGRLWKEEKDDEKIACAAGKHLCRLPLRADIFRVFSDSGPHDISHSGYLAVEIGRAMFLTIVFLGTPILIYEDGQMAVTMIKDLFQGKRAGMLTFNIWKISVYISF